MPALNFKSQFVPKIVALEKNSTIRGKRKNPIKVGDVIKMYTGMRTKGCMLIGTAICSNITPVLITDEAPYLIVQLSGDAEPKNYKLTQDALKHFHTNDGFDTYKEMATFFHNQYGLPFVGDLIEWRDFKTAK